MVFLPSDDFLISPRPSSKTKKCLLVTSRQQLVPSFKNRCYRTNPFVWF